MSSLPQPLDHLLTGDEYAELGETEWGYTELLEGCLLMSPSPVSDHNVAAAELLVHLRPQLPDHLEVVPDVDLDADAAIPHYWIGDLDEPVSLLKCHLAEGFGYQDGGGVSGAFSAAEPFPVGVELDRLI